MDIIIRQLNNEDMPSVMELISTDHLRPEGILEEGTRYWGAFNIDRIVGVIGCEYENNCGLLRSALVDKQYRGYGIAAQLTKVLFHEAKKDNLESIYLFSTEAGAYWMRFGFREVLVEEVVEKLANTPQVKLFNTLGWLPTEIAYKYSLLDS